MEAWDKLLIHRRSDTLRGTDALFTLFKNNKLSWIQDWLHYNQKVHGANAVVFPDNVSTDYSREELVRAIVCGKRRVL